jgi:hypothetical protein
VSADKIGEVIRGRFAQSSRGAAAAAKVTAENVARLGDRLRAKERAQAGLERERNAYWIRKAAEKVRRQDKQPRQARLTPIPVTRQYYPSTSGNGIWSQIARPARPSATTRRAEQ